MSVKTAYSTKELSDAVTDLKAQSGDCRPRAVIFFASSKYNPGELSRQMQAAFPDACVAGCSTAGEIASGKMISESVSVMFLDEETVGQTASAVVENLRDQVSVCDAFAKMERQLHAPVSSLDIEKYVGIVLADGLSGAEEALMEKIGDRTDVFFVGGSAGDDLKLEATHLMANGRVYTDAAVLVLLRLKTGFDIVKTQSFKPTGKTLVATKVEEGQRQVIEFDHSARP